MAGQSDDITPLLKRVRQGDQTAEQEVFAIVYDELRRLAGWFMQTERKDHTLQPTALVHEVYLKLIRSSVDWQDRAHFFQVAANTIRHILVDYARNRGAGKRPGTRTRVDLDKVFLFADTHADQLLAIDGALTRLAAIDQRQCKVVELRFFAGLSVEETAELLQVSTRTVKRDWNVARAWLYGQLG